MNRADQDLAVLSFFSGALAGGGVVLVFVVCLLLFVGTQHKCRTSPPCVVEGHTKSLLVLDRTIRMNEVCLRQLRALEGFTREMPTWEK